jgi:hypothetical protein
MFPHACLGDGSALPLFRDLRLAWNGLFAGKYGVKMRLSTQTIQTIFASFAFFSVKKIHTPKSTKSGKLGRPLWWIHAPQRDFASAFICCSIFPKQFIDTEISAPIIK